LCPRKSKHRVNAEIVADFFDAVLDNDFSFSILTPDRPPGRFRKAAPDAAFRSIMHAVMPFSLTPTLMRSWRLPLWTFCRRCPVLFAEVLPKLFFPAAQEHRGKNPGGFDGRAFADDDFIAGFG